MKRLVPIALLLVATSLFAFNPAKRGARVAILDPVPSPMSRQLARELRALGIDASEEKLTLGDVERDEIERSDFYVEIIADGGPSAALGGVGVGGKNVAVHAEVVVAHVAARVRVYDGASLEVIDTYELDRRNVTLMPTAVGFGDYRFAGWIALPFVHKARERSAMRGVAREAAQRIADTISKP